MTRICALLVAASTMLLLGASPAVDAADPGPSKRSAHRATKARKAEPPGNDITIEAAPRPSKRGSRDRRRQASAEPDAPPDAAPLGQAFLVNAV